MFLIKKQDFFQGKRKEILVSLEPALLEFPTCLIDRQTQNGDRQNRIKSDRSDYLPYVLRKGYKKESV
jgi:hypothetical protein